MSLPEETQQACKILSESYGHEKFAPTLYWSNME
jgi:hypothetical protein